MGLPQVWSVRQRGVVLGFVVVVILYLCIQYWREPLDVSDPQAESGARTQELASRVDPNVADAAMLSAIPMLGEKRAAEIVAYREEYLKSHPGKRPFNEPRDLLVLRNFGAATVSSIEPFLVFPTTQPVRGR